MQSKTEESIAEIEAYDTQTRQPRSFELYQEYSQCNVIKVVRNRRADYEKADKETKRRLEKEVEAEVEDFRAWLEETKGIQHTVAHYYSFSLKSVLLGLPIGVQIAELFDVILNNRFEKREFEARRPEQI
jgi:hypothetical protein